MFVLLHVIYIHPDIIEEDYFYFGELVLKKLWFSYLSKLHLPTLQVICFHSSFVWHRSLMQDHNHCTGLSWRFLVRCFAAVLFPLFFFPCSLTHESCCCVDLLRAIWCACWEARAAHLNKPVTLFTFVTGLDLHLGGMVCRDSFVTSFENVSLAINFWILRCITY